MLMYMRLTWIVTLVGCAGCWGDNPAFMVTEGTAGSSGDTAATGSTGRPPVESTGEPSTTTMTTTPVTTGPSGTTGEPPSGTTTEAGTTTGETTGETQPGTTDPNDTLGSTSGANAECGNGELEGDEVCDGGGNIPLPGTCSHDCQAIVAEKQIFAINPMKTGDFLSLDAADALCTEAAEKEGLEGTFKALISDGDLRVGSTTAFGGEATDDWPIQPYTGYVNPKGELVWVTGKLRLLGVLPGDPNVPAPLLAVIAPETDFAVWTGLKNDWRSTTNCEKWNGGDQALGAAGKPQLKVDFLAAAGTPVCKTALGFICVEQ